MKSKNLDKKRLPLFCKGCGARMVYTDQFAKYDEQTGNRYKDYICEGILRHLCRLNNGSSVFTSTIDLTSFVIIYRRRESIHTVIYYNELEQYG